MLTEEMGGSFICREPKCTSIERRSIHPASIAYGRRDLKVRSNVRG